ncbi:MAG TPA: hypothetical protein DCK76_06955 [Desulfotomaculum sp.]|nr:MAG: Uncharacterized protein XD84_2068 [Desulfotomaculum sp. 46_80]HAG11108.1 hypothetical protein [Desulfotomaculum sp.]HBY04580.1 hypothetical protein [Desulfotomaculum sp.]
MEGTKRQAVVVSLIKNMGDNGSWCGETHIQKSLYFLQEMLGVPLNFDFILYKHGPFSFDLRDELAVMRSNLLVELKSKPYPYGPSYLPGEAAERLQELYPKTSQKYKPQIIFISEKLSGLSVAELERLATALYVTLEEGRNQNALIRAIRINELKPHIKIDEAQKAVGKVDSIIREAEKEFH